MRKIRLNIDYEEYDQLKDLSIEEQALIKKAESSIDQAYAPYSNFYVGCALRLDNSEIVTGNNQENAAYPSGLCAERVAIFYASANFPNQKIEAIAIAAKSKSFDIKEIITPCGACRQVMAEYQTKQKAPIQLLLKGNDGRILKFRSVKDILPFMFHAEHLKK